MLLLLLVTLESECVCDIGGVAAEGKAGRE